MVTETLKTNSQSFSGKKFQKLTQVPLLKRSLEFIQFFHIHLTMITYYPLTTESPKTFLIGVSTVCRNEDM